MYTYKYRYANTWYLQLGRKSLKTNFIENLDVCQSTRKSKRTPTIDLSRDDDLKRKFMWF